MLKSCRICISSIIWITYFSLGNITLNNWQSKSTWRVDLVGKCQASFNSSTLFPISSAIRVDTWSSSRFLIFLVKRCEMDASARRLEMSNRTDCSGGERAIGTVTSPTSGSSTVWNSCQKLIQNILTKGTIPWRDEEHTFHPRMPPSNQQS